MPTGIKLTHQEVEKHYLEGGIKLLSHYVTNRTKNDLECLVCSHTWQASYGNYSSHGNGCPKCSGNAKLTHEDVAKHYLSGNIRLLSHYVTNKTKNNLECLKCGHEWSARYNDFAFMNAGCPNCYAQTQHSGYYSGNKAYSIIRARLRNTIAKETAISLQCFYNNKDIRSLSDTIEFVYRDCPKAHHVDHIIPFSWFDVYDPDQMAYCWHFLNLQYLPATKNIVKKDNITPQEMKQYLLDFPLIWMIALKAKFLPDSMRQVIIEAIENQEIRQVA